MLFFFSFLLFCIGIAGQSSVLLSNGDGLFQVSSGSPSSMPSVSRSMLFGPPMTPTPSPPMPTPPPTMPNPSSLVPFVLPPDPSEAMWMPFIHQLPPSSADSLPSVLPTAPLCPGALNVPSGSYQSEVVAALQ